MGRHFDAILATLAVLALGPASRAQEPATGLYQQPVLVLETGVHMAPIFRADVDAEGRTVVTGSLDRTLRLWSAESGDWQRTIRLPWGPGEVGKVYAVAISPDGSTIAAGGWTRISAADPQEQVYLFDASTGEMLERIEGLPNVVHHLAFSPNGRRLAVGLHGGLGMRIFDRDKGWKEIASDAEYADSIFGVAFAADGRFATSSDDGYLRLYDLGGRLLRRTSAGGGRPLGLAFRPDGTRLAVGFDDSTAVRIFDGHSLELLAAPDTTGINRGNLSSVAWSSDGTTLFAGGTHLDADGSAIVVAWGDSRDGQRRIIPTGHDTIMTLRSLPGVQPGGDLLVVAKDPWMGRFSYDGTASWIKAPQRADLRGQRATLGISADGMMVDFDYGPGGETRVRFDLKTLTLSADPPNDGLTEPSTQDSSTTSEWVQSIPLGLDPHEDVRSFAIDPTGTRLLVGADWSLRAFDAQSALWRRAVPDTAVAVNISGDGRLALAAYGDGTLRWYRMEDGTEILALFLLADRANWVAWTPEGVYAASPGARTVLRWHINRGWDRTGDLIPAASIGETHRPDVIEEVVPELGLDGALAVAEKAKIGGAIQAATGATVAPGARLHLLAVGISDFGPNAANLKLDFADDDAEDIANALRSAQRGFYANVLPQVLVNGDATRDGILAAMGRMKTNMSAGGGDDLAVVTFSGHGAIIDGMFYLLPHGVDGSDLVTIASTALSGLDFQRAVASLTGYGRVIVLIDACHSGATTGSGAALAGDTDRLREIMRGENVTVLTSSTADQISVEDKQWRNGAFTEAVLEALTTRADQDSNGLISMLEMTRYIAARVPEITGGAQSPGIDTRFESNVFVAGL